MNNLWVKISCRLICWDYKILKSCSAASRKQLKKYVSALSILMILWGLTGYLFAARYVHASTPTCIFVSLALIFIIIQIERQIILTIGKTKGVKTFRITIAILMSIIGSSILDQILFKEDINKEMIGIVNKETNAQLPGRIQLIDSELIDQQKEIDSLIKTNKDLYTEITNHPTIKMVSTTRNPITIRKIDGTDSIVFKTSISANPIPNPKIKEAETNTSHLNDLRKRKQELNEKKRTEKETLRSELASNQGFLAELNAVAALLSHSLIASIFYVLLFILLVSFELFIVYSKMNDDKCDYDLIIEHQLNQRKKTLKQLTEDQTSK